MKYFKIFFILLVCILFASCEGQYTKNSTILHAEDLLKSSPNSAQKILLSIPQPEKLSKEDYAAWCLNFTYSQYKLYQDIKSDSIILISVNYYDNRSLPKQCVTAYYLLGSISEMNNNYEKAMQAFKHAEDLIGKIDDNKLKGLIYFHMGFICFQEELYNQSLKYFKKSRGYYHLTKNKSDEACAYRNISDMYFALQFPLDSVLRYSDLALKLSKEAGDTKNYYCILSRRGELLVDHDQVLAKEYILQGYHFLPDRRSFYATFLAHIYSRLNRPDSARFYLNIALTDTLNMEDRTAKYLAGAYVTKKEGNTKKAFDFLEKAYQNRETVFQHSIHSQLYRIDKKFDLNKKEQENAQLKISNQRKVILISLLIIGILILSLIISLVIILHKKRIMKIDLTNQINKQMMKNNIINKQTENEQKQKLLLAKLHSRIDNTLFFNRINMGLSQLDKKEEFENMIFEQSVLSENDWQYYIDEVDEIFDKKVDSIVSKFPELSKLDLIVISLICLQIDISDSCSLLNMTKSTMYKRRNRIKERVGLERDIDLEEWIIHKTDLKIKLEALAY